MAINFQQAEFIRSATAPKDFPRDGLPQVAFAGRSNVGKSSVINRLLGRKNFARVGAAPGKTVHINYFLIDKTFYLVDLPGYGYAKVSKAERDRWGRLMEDYFADRELMTFGAMIVDARHKPTADDCTMAQWYRDAGCPFVVVANKLDKLKKREIESNLLTIRETLELDESVKLIPFSAEKGEGKQELLDCEEARPLCAHAGTEGPCACSRCGGEKREGNGDVGAELSDETGDHPILGERARPSRDRAGLSAGPDGGSPAVPDAVLLFCIPPAPAGVGRTGPRGLPPICPGFLPDGTGRVAPRDLGSGEDGRACIDRSVHGGVSGAVLYGAIPRTGPGIYLH